MVFRAVDGGRVCTGTCGIDDDEEDDEELLVAAMLIAAAAIHTMPTTTILVTCALKAQAGSAWPESGS